MAPGFLVDVGGWPVTVTIGASMGLSLSDYDQDANGNDDAFGFAQVGLKLSAPLGDPGRSGAWTLNAGIAAIALGDNTSDLNGGDASDAIATIGLQWNF